jgi:signal transduction histidine kinase
LVEFLNSRDPAWAEKYLKGRMDLYRIDMVWVLQADGTVVYGYNRATESVLANPSLPPDELGAVFAKNDPFRFHQMMSDGLYQIQGMPIMPRADMDRRTPALGWLVVAKRWGDAVLEDMADIGRGRVLLTGPAHQADTRSPQELEAWQPLRDHRGVPIVGLDFHVNDPQVEDPDESLLEISLFVLNSVSIILLAGVLMHYMILRPFLRVRASLLSSDATPLLPLLGQSNEFGQMARIVQSSLRDREQLVRNIEERVQLARDLHDGVIQRVYGAGMALSKVQAQLPREQTTALELLDETRGELNRIIAEIRGHIEKADPRPLDTTFGEAVARLILQMHGPGPVTTELNIDEALMAEYPSVERMQILQFVRETLSNAIRHGAPSRLLVTWQRTPTGAKLVVGDNGRGFDPNEVKAGGRGLDNLRERALTLGGHLQLESQEDQGTTVCLELPPGQGVP